MFSDEWGAKPDRGFTTNGGSGEAIYTFGGGGISSPEFGSCTSGTS